MEQNYVIVTLCIHCVAKKVYLPTFDDDFNSSCPIWVRHHHHHHFICTENTTVRAST